MLTSEAAVAAEMNERNGRKEPSVAMLSTKGAETIEEAAQATANENERLIELPSAKRSKSTRTTKA